MRIYICAAILIAGVLLMALQGTSKKAGSKNATLQAEPALSAKLDAIFQPLANAKTPGLAALIRQNGRTIFEHGYGARDLHTLAPIGPRTNFRLASFSKQFTAAAIMLLVRDGKLRYDESLSDIFPEFPAYGRAITVRNLLNHDSGLPDYEDLMDAAAKSGAHAAWTATNQIHDEEVLRLLESQTHGKFAPGTSWAYSNSAYVVLGCIVAKVSGEPFGQFLHKRIFAPLHMDRTLVYEQGKNEVPERAFGYSRHGKEFAGTDQSATSATLGDGGVYSNLEDLAKWDDALRNFTFLNEGEIHEATTPVALKGGAQPKWPAGSGEQAGQPVSYGFGWFVDPYNGRARMWHAGDTSGFHTVIERFTRENLTIVILCNRTDLDPAKLALEAADGVFAAKR